MKILFLAAALVLPQQQHDRHHSFAETDRWVEEFESAERDATQKPDEVVRALNLSPGAAVADIGTGTGYFTRRFARAVGDSGVAYAVDLEPKMLQYVAARAEKESQTNIVPVLATASNPMLAPESVDLFFICNTIHHIDDRNLYYEILKRDLRPGGRLAIVDFQKDAELTEGPSKEMRIAKEALIEELAASGFGVAEDHDFLPVQYFLVFELAR